MLQLRLSLTDLGEPNRRSAPDHVMNFTIQQNKEPPIFFDTVYYKTIDEDENAGFPVITLSAQDADTSVSFHVLLNFLFTVKAAPHECVNRTGLL